MGKNKSSERQINLLDLIPERTVDHELDDDGIVTILSPRFKSRIMKKLIEPRLKNRFLKVKLDEIGSSVWLLCDGESSVKHIGERVREQYGEKIEPCYDRLSMFFTQLELSEYIRYKNLDTLYKGTS